MEYELQFGVEIEFYNVHYDLAIAELRAAGLEVSKFAGYTHEDSETAWKVTTDSSVTSYNTGTYVGLELVSPILKGDKGLDDLRTALTVLSNIGARVDSTCGLHVHHNASSFDHQQLINIVNLYYTHQAGINTILPKSRRTSARARYCKPIPTRSLAAINYERRYIDCNTENEKLMKAVHSFTTRYLVINLHAFLRHKTVEFRQHSGTLDADKAEAWILLTYQMMRYASTHTVDEPQNNRKSLQQLLETIGLEDTWVSDYLNSRQIALANR